MKFTVTDTLSKEQKHQILELWNQEYPKKVSLADLAAFKKYLQGLADKHHILLCDSNGIIKGWLIYFIRDKEKFFAMILDRSIQGKGWGTKFLNEAKKFNSELNGWVLDHNRALKANGEKYISPVGFYGKNGFQILSEEVTIEEGVKGVKITWKK